MKKPGKNIPELKGRSLLLHVCCGPCAAGCVERLLAHYDRVGLYYSNSNICTADEFEKRLCYVRELADHFDLPLSVDSYDHASWLSVTEEYREEPEGGLRCGRCFGYSLGRAAAAAARLGYESFATSLTVSPRKSSDLVFAAGREYSGFTEWNFKKDSGYLRGLELAKGWNFYRQDFCGCEFSLRSREKSGANGQR